MRVAAPLGLLAAALVLALPATSATGFTPKLLAGTWNGSWTNTTFGSTGPAKIVAGAPGTKLTFTVDFGGNVFGCQDPPAGGGAITKGTGANHWSPAGFTIKRTGPAFGTTTIVYTHSNKKLRGNGFNPTCNPGLKWTLDGAFAGKTFSGTVNITLPDGSKATSKLALTRS